jgi:hypothetical protein
VLSLHALPPLLLLLLLLLPGSTLPSSWVT